MRKKNFDTPDETKTPPNAKTDTVKIANGTVMRNTFEPGWRWSKDIKPTAGTDSCQMRHVLCGISGQLNVVADDGAEIEVGPGDVADILPGHDAWVVGNEPAVLIDIAGHQN